MPATTLMAAFVHRHARKLALSALFLTAVVLSVSFVASVHGVNRLALEKVVVFSHRQAPEMLAIDTADTVPRLQNALDILDATTRHSAVEEATGSKDSLAEAQKLVDEYGAGSFSSVADSPAAITAPHHDVQAFSSTSDGLALAPPLPGSVEPAYTSLSAHWVPMKAASHQAAVLASSGSQCFDVKNLKKFLPPGFGSVLKSAKKGSNPLDKFLTKAMLPTFGELQVSSPASTSRPNRFNVAAGCREVRSIHSQSAQNRRPLTEGRFVGLSDHRQVHDQPCEHLRQVPVQPQHAGSIRRAQSRAHGQLRVWSALQAG